MIKYYDYNVILAKIFRYIFIYIYDCVYTKRNVKVSKIKNSVKTIYLFMNNFAYSLQKTLFH